MKMKDIPGWEGKYAVTKDGRVWSYRTSKYLKPNGVGTRRQYLSVLFWDRKKGVQNLVHRLVAAAFVPNPDGKPWVNHIDCNPQNNNANNLEWVTPKENHAHAWENGLYTHGGSGHHSAKLTDADVLDMIALRKGGMEYGEVAQRYGVTKGCAHHAITGRTWKHLDRS